MISFLRECSTALLWASSVVEQVEALHSSLVLEIRNKKYTFWNKVTFSVVINLGNHYTYSISSHSNQSFLPCPWTRGSIPFFRNKFQRLFPRIFQDSDQFFSGLQISCEQSNYLATIFTQIIWMGRIMISMITMTIKSKLLTSTQSKEEASLNSCCIYEMLQKNHKNQEWFPRGTKTVKLISYLNKILFQTTTHKLGADPEIFHEGGGRGPKIPINLMRLIKFPQTLPQELPLDLLTWQK